MLRNSLWLRNYNENIKQYCKVLLTSGINFINLASQNHVTLKNVRVCTRQEGTLRGRTVLTPPFQVYAYIGCKNCLFTPGIAHCPLSFLLIATNSKTGFPFSWTRWPFPLIFHLRKNRCTSVHRYIENKTSQCTYIKDNHFNYAKYY